MAFYLQVNNLPVEERIKKENTILLCLIEGPGEPNTSQTQRLLTVLTNQLKPLYFGVQMSTFNSGKNREDYGATVKACLYQVLCDIPMQRKLSGFTGFSSTRSCFRCDRSFVIFPETSNLDYSGFETCHYIPNANKRLNDIQSEKWLYAHNNAERKRQDRLHGIRFSVLRSLRYVDLVKMTTQDYLHCIWLGLAKSILSKYEERGFFRSQHYLRYS